MLPKTCLVLLKMTIHAKCLFALSLFPKVGAIGDLVHPSKQEPKKKTNKQTLLTT